MIRNTKEQLVQIFQKSNPGINPNSPVNSPQLFTALNQMSLKQSSVPYNQTIFEELVERVNSSYNVLTVSNYLDVHLLAVDILHFRQEQFAANEVQFRDFIQHLQSRINELSGQHNMHQPTPGFFVFFKQFQIREHLLSGTVQLRLYNEQMGIDQTMPFVNSNGMQTIILQNEKAGLDSLDQNFKMEVFDDSTNYGFAQLNIYQMNLGVTHKISLPLTIDSLKTNYTLEVDGYVLVENVQFAQEDLATLKQNLSQLNEDLGGVIEQINELNSPFNSVGASSLNNSRLPIYQEPPQMQSQQHQAYQQQQPQTQYQQNFNPYQEQIAPHQAQPYNQNADSGKNQHPQNDEGCELNTQTLVFKIHLFLIAYLLIAVLFCLKRPMFLDVSISIALISVLYKVDLKTNNGPILLKLFIALFIFSACLDFGWLIVFFPSWNRDLTSEDQGAQSGLRVLMLGGSLIFLVYKVVIIIAIVYLNKLVETNSINVKENFSHFFDGAQSNAPKQTSQHLQASNNPYAGYNQPPFH